MISIHYTHIHSESLTFPSKAYKQALQNGEIIRPYNWKKFYKIDYKALTVLLLGCTITLMFFYI